MRKLKWCTTGATKLWMFLFFMVLFVPIIVLTVRVMAVNEEHSTPTALVIKRQPVEVTTKHEYTYTPLSVDYEVYDDEIPDTDAVFLAKTIYGEYRNAENKEQCAAVAWNILNRVDDSYYPNTVEEVVTQRSQYSGYNSGNPVDAELYNIALDVLYRWRLEKLGVGDVGRILPKEYLYFTGNGVVNIYRDSSGNKWAWSLPSPY